jgi:AcrR family transcriptional regulator
LSRPPLRKLVYTALEQVGTRGYEAAGVTTGSLYHHFGSKLGLYEVVREEAERRVLDRMEGAAARAGDEAPAVVRAALLVGFDYVAGQRLARLLAEPHPQPAPDRARAALAALAFDAGPPARDRPARLAPSGDAPSDLP